MNEDEIKKLAAIALAHEEGGNLSLWPVPENEEEREYWKEVWKLGAIRLLEVYKSEIYKLLSENKALLESVDRLETHNQNLISAAERVDKKVDKLTSIITESALTNKK